MVSAPNSGTHTSVFVRSFDAYALAHDLCARIRCVGASPTSHEMIINGGEGETATVNYWGCK